MAKQQIELDEFQEIPDPQTLPESGLPRRLIQIFGSIALSLLTLLIIFGLIVGGMPSTRLFIFLTLWFWIFYFAILGGILRPKCAACTKRLVFTRHGNDSALCCSKCHTFFIIAGEHGESWSWSIDSGGGDGDGDGGDGGDGGD